MWGYADFHFNFEFYELQASKIIYTCFQVFILKVLPFSLGICFHIIDWQSIYFYIQG